MEVDSTDDVVAKASTTGQVVDWFANVARSDLAESVDPEAGSTPEASALKQAKTSGSTNWSVGVIGSLAGRLKRIPMSLLASLAAAAVILFVGFTLLGDDEASREAPDDVTPGIVTADGSFDSPYPFGLNVTMSYNDLELAEAREWRVQVLEAVLDNSTPAGSGQTTDAYLAKARIRLTYHQGTGDGPVTDLRLNAIGQTGSVYPAKVEGCASQADRLERTELEAGQAIEGWVCWPVPSEELAALIMAVEAVPADGVLYMELQGVVEE